MTAEILSRVIEFGICKKIEKLEQSSNQHCSEIVFCESLVDYINSKFYFKFNRII